MTTNFALSVLRSQLSKKSFCREIEKTDYISFWRPPDYMIMNAIMFIFFIQRIARFGTAKNLNITVLMDSQKVDVVKI